VQGVLNGFTTIGLVIAVGALLAHLGVVDLSAQHLLSRLAFFVASPALMVVTLSHADVHQVLSANLGASVAAVAVAAGTYIALARWWWHRSMGQTTIGALSSSYVNAGNLGIAIAAYVVGDITVVVPTLLVQMLLVQPAALIVLDRITGRGDGVGPAVRRLVTNPLTISAVVGLVLATTGWRLPAAVMSPLEMLAGAAIPLMLMSYGAALRLSPPIGRAGHNGEVVLATVLKMAVMPLVAWLVGLALGLDDRVLLGVVITAALPTAQNIFLHATRYRVGEDVSRETILVTTLASLPVALLVAVLLG